MKNKSAWILGAAAAASLFLATAPAHAAVIVAEDFGGSGGALTGTTANTFASGITAAGGSSTWVADPGFLDDGSVSVSRRAAYLNLGSYINDAKGTANGKFDLTMTISETTGAWISLGFSTLNTPATTFDFTGAEVPGLGTIVYRCQRRTRHVDRPADHWGHGRTGRQHRPADAHRKS